MKSSRLPLLLGPVVALASLGGVFLMARRHSEELSRTESLVVHTNQVLTAISHSFGRVKSAESAMRGAIVAGDGVLLQDFEEDRALIGPGLDRLADLMRDNPSQQARLARLRRFVDARLKSLEDTRALARKEGLPAAAAYMSTGPARQLSLEIRGVFEEMEEEENRLLVLRTRESEESGRQVRTFFMMVLFGAGTILLALGLLAIRIVEERRRAEEELDQLFSTSLDLMGIASLATGKFTRVSPSWERTLGWTPEEVTSKTWLEFVHPDDHAATIAEAGKLGKGISVVTFENRYRARDGSYRWLSWKTPAPLPGSATLFAVARDVTDLRRKEEEIVRLNGELARRVDEALAANRELESFSYSVSHDLRAPLRAIDGFSRILVEDFGQRLDEEGNRLLAVVCQNARQMGALIDDLLQFSRLGRKPPERGPVDLQALVAEVVDQCRAESPDREVEVRIGPLPAVQADRTLLRQVWVNLISNAFKYSRPRKPARIEVGSERIAGENVFFVRDNGVGFDMKYVDKLFGVFQRLHSPRDFEGTGVGLAIVDRVVRHHGGRVWAEGRPDEGAVFRFSLPD